MHTFGNTFNTFILSTLRTMLAYKKNNNRRPPTMSLLFKSLFSASFPGLLSVQTATHFEDDAHPGLKLTSIHTFSKSLSYLRKCELREPKGYRTTLIYLKTTTYQVGQLGRLPPCQTPQIVVLTHFCPMSKS